MIRFSVLVACLFFCKHLIGQSTDLGTEQYSSSQNIHYLVGLPKDYGENQDKKYPLLLFLHGGDRSNTRHHPKKYALKNQINFPFIVAAPHCTSGCSWNQIDFDQLLEEIVSQYSVDKNRIYLTGYSMGAYASWNLLSRSPHWFAAAAPIAGGGEPSNICKAREVSIRAYHGANDRVIPQRRSEIMIDQLKSCQGKAELVIYPNTDHGSWILTYQDPEFYEWLLSKSKN